MSHILQQVERSVVIFVLACVRLMGCRESSSWGWGPSTLDSSAPARDSTQLLQHLPIHRPPSKRYQHLSRHLLTGSSPLSEGLLQLCRKPATQVDLCTVSNRSIGISNVGKYANLSQDVTVLKSWYCERSMLTGSRRSITSLCWQQLLCS